MLDIKYIDLIKKQLENVQDPELKKLINMLIDDNINLKKENVIDPLTGLYNRRIFENLTKLPSIVIMCDIDDFKEINDTYGHDKGDYVLKELGKILKENFRNTDYVCRLGGDEFLIAIIDYSNVQSILKRCEKIKLEIHNRISLPKHKLTISIGLALNNKCDSLNEIIKKADKALYESKEKGKNQVMVEDKK